MTFLTDVQLRPLASGGMPGSKTLGFALGQGQAPLEVVVMESATQPAVTAMRTAWRDRHGGRAAPVLDRKSTRQNSSHQSESRMPSSA